MFVNKFKYAPRHMEDSNTGPSSWKPRCLKKILKASRRSQIEEKYAQEDDFLFDKVF
jgi:hypothetical protein